jgi:hypothetical protein
MGYKKQYVQLDGTPKTYNTSRQGETYLYITGSGDDLENNIRGAGPALKLNGPGELSIGFLDDIYLKDGFLFWSNAIEGDTIGVDIILPANTLFPNPTNTGNYDYINGEVIENNNNTGEYMMYPIDITLNRFINKFEVVGTNEIGLVIESSDTALIPSQLRMKIVLESLSSNQDVVVRFVTEIYREVTV